MPFFNFQNRLLAAAAGAGLACLAGMAGAQAGEPLPDNSYRVAQAYYDILIDEDGREILVDPETGEIVGYADQRRSARRERRAERRERRRRLGRVLDFFDRDDDIIIEDDYVERDYRERPRRGDRGFFLDELEESRRQRRARRDREQRRSRQRDQAIRRESLPPAGEPRQDQPRAADPEVVIVDPSLRNDGVDRGAVTGTVNKDPQWNGGGKLSRGYVAKLQIFLDREGFSPGVIDGGMGSNVRKAVDAWKSASGRSEDLGDPQVIDRLAATGGEAFIDYTITEADVAGPFISAVPVDYARKAELPAMSFTSPAEKLAERFHMSETYLRRMNEGANFHQPGTVIRVANTGGNVTQKVHYIIADKSKEQVRALDRNGKLVAAYPATIGSTSTPSPSGIVEVARIAINPEYTYNPKINFTQGDNTEILRIPPGPNGPVGSVWIALSKKTYGIHGTPEPDKIGKTNSNGCIRLTNWDAHELAKLVKPGVTVEFME